MHDTVLSIHYPICAGQSDWPLQCLASLSASMKRGWNSWRHARDQGSLTETKSKQIKVGDFVVDQSFLGSNTLGWCGRPFTRRWLQTQNGLLNGDKFCELGMAWKQATTPRLQPEIFFWNSIRSSCIPFLAGFFWLKFLIMMACYFRFPASRSSCWMGHQLEKRRPFISPLFGRFTNQVCLLISFRPLWGPLAGTVNAELWLPPCVLGHLCCWPTHKVGSSGRKPDLLPIL